jgi:hypothetical protein
VTSGWLVAAMPWVAMTSERVAKARPVTRSAAAAVGRPVVAAALMPKTKPIREAADRFAG